METVLKLSKNRISRILISSILCILFFSNCNNSCDTIFEDLNEKCAVEFPEEKLPSILDADFDEKKMLTLEAYAVHSDSWLVFKAPVDGQQYKWTLVTPRTKKTKSKTEVLSETRVFAYELPGIFVQDGSNIDGDQNELILEITTSDGKKFVDKAKIILLCQ